MNGSGTGGASGGGAGGMDAGGSGGVGGTGGSGNVPSWAEPVSHTSEGVLTNHPEFQFSTSGDFAVTSAYFILTQRSTFNSFTIFGDFENRGAVMRCVPLVTITVGDTPVTSVGNGPVYESSSFIGANFPCFPPGAAGVFNSIANDVPPTLLDSPTTVTISITGSEPSEPAVPHPDEPAVLSPKIAEVQGGWGVSGVIQTTSNPIHNFGIDVFVRDVSGVLFDLALAHPGGLGTLPVSAQLLFDSTAAMHGVGNVIDGPFAGFVIYTSFLEGTSTLEEGARSELQARLSISAARRSEMAELRRRFDESTREIRLQRSSISSK